MYHLAVIVIGIAQAPVAIFVLIVLAKLVLEILSPILGTAFGIVLGLVALPAILTFRGIEAVVSDPVRNAWTVLSLRTADLDLTECQIARIARMFSIDPATIRRMTFSNIPQSSRRLIAGEPRQLCCGCRPNIDGSPSFFEANFSAGGSPARFVGASFRALACVTAPLLQSLPPCCADRRADTRRRGRARHQELGVAKRDCPPTADAAYSKVFPRSLRTITL